MKTLVVSAAVGLSALLAGPASGQAGPASGQQAAQRGTTQPGTQPSADEMQAADKAAGSMVERIYVYEPVTHRSPSEVIAKLQQLGYTDIHDFDVEWGHYEIEAKAPGGRDVEIKVDPRTGAIIDIDDNLL